MTQVSLLKFNGLALIILLIAFMVASTTMPQTAEWMEEYMKLPIILMGCNLLKDLVAFIIFKTRGRYDSSVKKCAFAFKYKGVLDHPASPENEVSTSLPPSIQEKKVVMTDPPTNGFPWISLDKSFFKKIIPRLKKMGHICDIDGHVVEVHPRLPILALAGYAGCSDVNIAIYLILESGKLDFLTSLAGGRNVSDISFHATLPVLAVSDQDHLRIFAFDEAYNFRHIGDYESTFSLAKPQPSPKIKALVFQLETNILAAIRIDGTVKLFQVDPVTFKLSDLFSFEAYKSVGYGISFVPGNSSQIVTCGMDCLIKLWQLNHDSTACVLVSQYEWERTYVSKIVFDPHSHCRIACIGSNDRNVMILDITKEGFTMVMSFGVDVGARCISSICWHPTIPGLMAVGGRDGYRGKVCICQINPETKATRNLLMSISETWIKDPEIKSLEFIRCFDETVKLVVVCDDSSFIIDALICPKQ
jgi:WD40 repeat protein